MPRTMLFVTMFLAIFLIVLPLHEEVTLVEEASIIGMVASCVMIHLRCVRSVLFVDVQVNPRITMADILERHPEYRYPRNSHRI